MSALADIVTVGACGALGMNSLQLAMCARSGCLEPRSARIPGSVAVAGICLAGGLGKRTGYERMLALAVPAALEAGRTLEAPVGLMLALPSRGRADDDERFDATFVGALRDRTGLPIDPARSVVFRQGHAGIASAMARAVAELATHEHVLVGGVSSYFHGGVIDDLRRGLALHEPELGGGLTPSEAAAFLLLRRTGGDGALARVLSVEIDRTDAFGPEAPAAAALTRAVHRAMGRGDEGLLPLQHDVSWVLTDTNGEPWRIDEWTRAAIRAGVAARPSHRLADLMGDVEAASGAVACALACTWWRVGCAPGASALLSVSQHGGPVRGAMVITRGGDA